MLIIKTLLIVIEVICSCLLIGVILLQKSKGEGLGLAFGSHMGESLFGARASNVLVKVTLWLGIIFLATTTALAIIYSHSHQRTLMPRGVPGAHNALPLPGPAPAAAPTSLPPQAQPIGPALPPPGAPLSALPIAQPVE